MYHPLGPDVVLSTTTEEEETTEGKETTSKFFAKPCFVTILSLQFPLLSILSAIFLSVLHSEEPTTTTTKTGCTDVCDPDCENYVANNPDCDEGKDISSSY